MMWLGASATQTSVSQAISARYFIIARLVKKAFNRLIQLSLGRKTLSDPATERDKLIPRRIAERSKVGGIDLSVAAELAEIGIDDSRVQERGQPLRHGWRQARSSLVEIIEVVLESDLVGFHSRGIVYGGHDPARFFFGREPFYENVMRRGDRELIGSRAESQCMRFPGPPLRPFHITLSKMAGINKRDRISSRLDPEEALRAKVHYAAGRDGQAEFGQVRFQVPHSPPDRVTVTVGSDMDESMAVAGPDEIGVANCPAAQVGIARPEARRGDDASPGIRRLLGTEHDILLQDRFLGEGAIPRIEYMDMAEPHAAQEETAKRLEIRSVAKTSRGDRYHLPSGSQKPACNGEESRIQVACLDSDLPEQPALGGFGADLPIRRI